MNRFTPKVDSEPHVIPTMTVRLRTDGMNGGVEFDSVVARNVSVELIYTYSAGAFEDGEEVMPSGVKIQVVRTTSPAWFDSESGAVLSFTVGSCLMKLMTEHDIEALEEELLKKLETQ